VTPANIEAEQQLLGALLLWGNGAGRVMAEAIHAGGASLFHDPVHARIFDVIRDKDKAGHLVSPITLRDAMQADAGLNELGGPAYLVRLAGAAISPAHADAYVDLLADLRRKRDLLAIMSEAQASITRGEDGADIIASRLEASLMQAEPVGASRPVSMLKATTDALVLANKAYQGEDSGAIRSGVLALDRIVPGFFPGELILLGGRPSMGKTAVALTFALNAARAGHGVCIASLEMTPESMAMRALSEATASMGRSVTYKQMRTGLMEEAEMRAVVDVSESVGVLPIHFLPPSYRDIGALLAGVKQVKAKMGGNLRLVVIDYLQLLRGTGKGRYEEITEISIALKAMALQLHVPVIALSQLSRAVEQREEKRPVLSDLRESGQLEQDADTVLFCYRNEYYLERERPDPEELDNFSAWQQAMDAQKNRLEVIVAKQRQGDIGTAHMRFNAATNVIWEDAWARAAA
jgi:replicative DNA helicase